MTSLMVLAFYIHIDRTSIILPVSFIDCVNIKADQFLLHANSLLLASMIKVHYSNTVTRVG